MRLSEVVRNILREVILGKDRNGVENLRMRVKCAKLGGCDG